MRREPKPRFHYDWNHYAPEVLRMARIFGPVLRSRGLRLEVFQDPRTKEIAMFIEVSPDRVKLVAVKVSERAWWLTPSMQRRYWARFERHLSEKLGKVRGLATVDSEILVLTGRFGRRHVGPKGHRVHLRRSPSGATFSTINFSYYQSPKDLARLIGRLLRKMMEAQLKQIIASCQAKGVPRPYGRLKDFCDVLSDLVRHIVLLIDPG